MSEKIEIIVPEGKIAKQVTNGNSISITFEDKQEDLSVSVTSVNTNVFLSPRIFGKYDGKSFCISGRYNWEIKADDYGVLCLIPTKK